MQKETLSKLLLSGMSELMKAHHHKQNMFDVHWHFDRAREEIRPKTMGTAPSREERSQKELSLSTPTCASYNLCRRAVSLGLAV